MNSTVRTWPRIASALVIALAAGVVWGIVTVWGGFLFTQLSGADGQVYEYVHVTRNGTPVIQTSSNQMVTDQTFRTLDGQPYEPKTQDWLTQAYFQKPIRPPGLVEASIPWTNRVAAISDLLRPPRGWYLVRDDQPLGQAYFVGYDELSRLRIGYIGRKGFRRSVPPEDERFELGRQLLTYGTGVLASNGYIQYGAHAYAYSMAGDNQRLAPWIAFLIDGDRLLEIDLRARTVRTLYESPELVSVAVVTEPPASEFADPTPIDAQAPAETEDGDHRPAPLVSRVALKLVDRVVVIDPPTGNEREFMLPEVLRDQDLYVYVVRENQLLLHWWPEGYYRGAVNLAWLEPGGTIAREETVVLAQWRQPTERETAWMVAGVAPVPIGWTLGLGVGAPAAQLQAHQAATYGEALAKGLAIAWPPLVAVILVGVVLGWITYWLQRKNRRPSTGAWVTLVSLLGLPGFLAYWLEQRSPKLEACDECREIVPRDRDACAACDSQFAAPPRVGTEIFA